MLPGRALTMLLFMLLRRMLPYSATHTALGVMGSEPALLELQAPQYGRSCNPDGPASEDACTGAPQLSSSSSATSLLMHR